MNKALLIVDVQNDFCPGGSYPVPLGDEVVRPLNQMLTFARKEGWLLIASRDWHTRDLFEDEKKMHCIQHTKGAQYHKDLAIDSGVILINKGSHDVGPAHYSAFNGDDIRLHEVLKKQNIHTVYIGGLAFDYCVKSTALDAKEYGYTTIVLTDACRAVKNNPLDIRKVEILLTESGARLLTVAEVISGVH